MPVPGGGRRNVPIRRPGPSTPGGPAPARLDAICERGSDASAGRPRHQPAAASIDAAYEQVPALRQRAVGTGLLRRGPTRPREQPSTIRPWHNRRGPAAASVDATARGVPTLRPVHTWLGPAAASVDPACQRGSEDSTGRGPALDEPRRHSQAHRARVGSERSPTLPRPRDTSSRTRQAKRNAAREAPYRVRERKRPPHNISARGS